MTASGIFKLIKDNYIRNIWAAAVCWLVMLFMFPVSAFMSVSTRLGNQAILSEQDLALAREYLYNDFCRLQDGSTVPAVLLITGTVLAFSLFSYLHDIRKTDFYHSLPITRTTLFTVNTITGLIDLLVPYLVMSLASALIIYQATGIPGCMGYSLRYFLINTGFFLMLYMTAVLSVILTGTRLTGLLLYFVICFWGLYAAGLADALMTRYFTTYYSIYARTQAAAQILSPVGWVMLQGNISPEQRSAAAFAAATVLCFLNIRLYRLRRSESASGTAGGAMAFRHIRGPVKILIVVPTALGAMLFFGSMAEDAPFWTAFALVSATLITHAIVEIIFNMDFRAVINGRASLAACLLCAIFLLAFFRYDVTGYDEYVPSADQVESAGLYTAALEDIYGSEDTVELTELLGEPFLLYTYYTDKDAVDRMHLGITGSASVVAAANEAGSMPGAKAVSEAETVPGVEPMPAAESELRDGAVSEVGTVSGTENVSVAEAMPDAEAGTMTGNISGAAPEIKARAEALYASTAEPGSTLAKDKDTASKSALAFPISGAASGLLKEDISSESAPTAPSAVTQDVDIANIFRIADAGIRDSADLDALFGSQSEVWDVLIGWHLKNGRTIYRHYYMDILSVEDELRAVHDSLTFKEAIYPLLTRYETGTAENVLISDTARVGDSAAIENTYEGNPGAGAVDSVQAGCSAVTENMSEKTGDTTGIAAYVGKARTPDMAEAEPGSGTVNAAYLNRAASANITGSVPGTEAVNMPYLTSAITANIAEPGSVPEAETIYAVYLYSAGSPNMPNSALAGSDASAPSSSTCDISSVWYQDALGFHLLDPANASAFVDSIYTGTSTAAADSSYTTSATATASGSRGPKNDSAAAAEDFSGSARVSASAADSPDFPGASDSSMNFSGTSSVSDSSSDLADSPSTSSPLELLYNTYCMELASLTYDTRCTEDPVATLQFRTSYFDEIDAELKASGSLFSSDELNYLGHYPVYPSFKGTLGLMEKMGADINMGLTADDISMIIINDYRETELLSDAPETFDMDTYGVSDDELLSGTQDTFDMDTYGISNDELLSGTQDTFDMDTYSVSDDELLSDTQDTFDTDNLDSSDNNPLSADLRGQDLVITNKAEISQLLDSCSCSLLCGNILCDKYYGLDVQVRLEPEFIYRAYDLTLDNISNTIYLTFRAGDIPAFIVERCGL